MISISDDAGGSRGKRRLLLSIHDVGPAFESEVDALHERLARRVHEGDVAMLVVPDHHGTAPIRGNSGFAARLRAWSALGIEMFAHGWFHRDTRPPAGRLDRLRARYMTAGEGEFLGLDSAEASARMRDGKALIEDIIGRPVAGFVAPAWLYGPGAHAALAGSDFALAEDHWHVWHPPSDRRLCTGPVITWASRSRARIRSSLAVAAAARAGLFRHRVLRMAVHPGDMAVPELLRSIDDTLAASLRHRAAARYAALLEDAGLPDPVSARGAAAPDPTAAYAR